jgi:transposase
MSKLFLSYEPDQEFLMPPSMREWLPEGHLAYFVSDLVDILDLSGILASYEGDCRGAPPFHPAMLTKIIFYGVCRGVYSSRKLSRATLEEIPFKILAAGNTPDFRTISEFRKRHLDALAALFKDVVQICRNAGLAPLKHISVDGTKINANASKHSAMSYDRMLEEEKRLLSEIEDLLKEGQSQDEAEDALHGSDKNGDELPDELAFREKRLAKIRKAKAELEQEAQELAAAKEAARAEKEAEAANSGKKLPGQKPKIDAKPSKKAQRNFTDPDSRIMKNSDKAYIQAYNGQAAVDSEFQIIVACDLTNQAADVGHLETMIDQVQTNTGETPQECSADTGYFSQENVTILEDRGIEAFIPPERLRHHEDPLPPVCTDPDQQSAADRQRAKLTTEEGRDKYSLRKETVEPVFGQTKFARGFRQFLLRGLENVKSEWALVCLGHNVLKLYRYGDRKLVFQRA